MRDFDKRYPTRAQALARQVGHAAKISQILITLVFMMRGGETRFQGRFINQTIFENMRY